VIIGAGSPDPGGVDKAERASKVLEERNAWLNGDRDLQLEMQLLEARISGLKGQDFFVADLHTLRHDWLLYLYNPQTIHENTLMTSETVGAKGRRYFIDWARWHKSGDYDQAGHYVMLPGRDGPRVMRIANNDMTLTLENTKTLQWTSTTTTDPLIDNLRALRFDLVNNASAESHWYDDSFYPVRVTSVVSADGQPLPFMHRRDQLLVLLPQPARLGAPVSITAVGTAEVIYQVTPESFGLLEAPFYPQYGERGGRATFHWTIRAPKQFTMAGSGRVVKEFLDKDRGQNVIELQSDIPVNFPWALFGQLYKSDGSYTSESTGKTVHLTIHTTTIGGSGTPMKKVQGFFEQTQQILKTFETVYGPYPYDELHIAQMGPGLGFGQGPPYFVQLTGEAFSDVSSLGSGSVHGFLSHEIAHQWWGNQVGWASEDDDWLSEGFAEYAAGTYIQGLQKQAGLQRTLDDWRLEAKNADKEAPIAAASMLNGPNAAMYRTGLLYNKAPYVLHMLRVQLGDETYLKAMRAIQETCRNQDVSTEMILREINRAAGADYSSFFDQWIWGVGIPTFRYSWRSEKQPDGKFLITVHIGQDDKVNFKKVLMPIHLHSKDKTIPTQFRPVVQPEQDIKLLSPIDPKDVTLDDDRTLLADFFKAG
jgi:hypothetical protein